MFDLRTVLLALLFTVASNVLAADSPAVATTNAHRSGWECDRAHRKADGTCLTVVVPANAFASDKSYGPGWECNRGYRQDNGSCVAVQLPAHAYLNSARGDTWQCIPSLARTSCPSDVRSRAL